jgi:hypothetical protein
VSRVFAQAFVIARIFRPLGAASRRFTRLEVALNEPQLIGRSFKLLIASGDKKSMRTILLLWMALCLATSSGCMVIDEIDKANAKMPATAKKKDKASEGGVATSKSVTPQKSALLEKSKQWWEGASSLAPAEMESSIVGCQFSDGTQFMSRDDCLSQGGVPSGRG